MALVVVAAVVGAVAIVLLATRTTPLVSQRCTATVDGRGYDLEPDQAANAALVTAVAVRRGLPARAATIAIATAVQESGLRNLTFGDRDSLGLFQQRPSQGWGTPEQLVDPVYATNAFYDALVEVDGYEGLEITVASDAVQRSAFPDAVADHELEGRAYASALTGNSPAALVCRLRPVEEPADADAAAQAVADAVSAELGDVATATATATAAGADGTAVTVSVEGQPEPDRLAWAVAQWAVAGADRRDVVAVSVAGSTWRRDGDAGWVDDDGAAPLGGVVIEVGGR